MKNIFFNLDFVTPKPQLHLKEKSRFPSVLGVIISIVSAAMMASISGYFIYRMFKRLEFNVLFNSEFYEYPSANMTNSGISFNIYTLDGKTYEDIQRYVTFLALHWDIKTDEQNNLAVDLNPIPLSKCTVEHFKGTESIFHGSEHYANSWCLDNIPNMMLRNGYGSNSNFSSIEIYIAKCVNSTYFQKSNCYPEEQRDAFLKQTLLKYTINDYYVDNEKFHTPLQIFPQGILRDNDVKLSKVFFHNLNMLEYISDDDYLLTSQRKIKSYHTSFQNLDISTTVGAEDSILPYRFSTLIFSFQKFKDVYSRRYMKIQNLLANIGGILKGVMFLAIVINKFFYEKILFFSLTNDLFFVVKNSSIYENNDNSRIQVQNDKSIKNNYIFDPNAKNLDQSHETVPQSSKSLSLLEKGKFKLKYSDYCCPIFCRSNQKMKNFKHIIEVYNKKISIDHIFTKLNDIDKILSVLFNDYQIEIFKNIPYIITNEDGKIANNILINKLISLTEFDSQKTKNIDQIIKNMKDNDSGLSLLDNKLIDIYENNLNA